MAFALGATGSSSGDAALRSAPVALPAPTVTATTTVTVAAEPQPAPTVTRTVAQPAPTVTETRTVEVQVEPEPQGEEPVEEDVEVEEPAETGTDPQFGTCQEANDAGYGPYTAGVDEEYDWYTDRDGDGVVCER